MLSDPWDSGDFVNRSHSVRRVARQRLIGTNMCRGTVYLSSYRMRVHGGGLQLNHSVRAWLTLSRFDW